MKIFSSIGLVLFVFIGSCTDEPKEKDVSDFRITKEIIEPKFKSFDTIVKKEIDQYFQNKLKTGVFNGNVLFYKSGKVFQSSYGVSNYLEKTALNDTNVFQLASGSKPVTAIAIMQLIEEGHLNLTDTVSHILDNFPYKGITIEMLLSHRSGLSNYMYITDSLWLNQEIPICNDNLLDSFIVKQPASYYPVDKKFNYCNTNYFLLAAIAEKVTGREFGSLLNEKIFDPLNMKHTQVYNDMDMRSIPNLAIGSENRKWHIPDYYLNGITGDKGVYSSTMDLLKLHMSLQSGEVLSYANAQEMYQPRSKFNYKNGSYGLGWRIIKQRENYPRIVYHLGWWRGYRSYFIRVPEQDIAIILLSNLSRGKFLSKDELLDLIL
jgi:CubicO group peptidase (beta-lactamase class C family)